MKIAIRLGKRVLRFNLEFYVEPRFVASHSVNGFVIEEKSYFCNANESERDAEHRGEELAEQQWALVQTDVFEIYEGRRVQRARYVASFQRYMVEFRRVISRNVRY